jgi:hypothetical protein
MSGLLEFPINVSQFIMIVISLTFITAFFVLWYYGSLYEDPPRPPPRRATPEELDQQAVLLRAETRRLQAQTENDEATMHAEMKRAELRDVRKFVTDHDRMNGGRA